jgi:hypothetical protein
VAPISNRNQGATGPSLSGTGEIKAARHRSSSAANPDQEQNNLSQPKPVRARENPHADRIKPPTIGRSEPSPPAADRFQDPVGRTRADRDPSRAAEVLGEKSAAMRWLGTPVRALGFATPISLLHDHKGREEVLTVLGRLEHGVL